MDINRAKEIISALAEGIDPTTGEILPDDSVCNKGDVVRAFYAVLNACENKKEIRKMSKKEPDDYDAVLFERLKVLRNKIATEKKQAAFTILANAPLMHMAAQKPTSEEELREIYGMGDCKIRQYGKVFIDEIKNYVGK